MPLSSICAIGIRHANSRPATRVSPSAARRSAICSCSANITCASSAAYFNCDCESSAAFQSEICSDLSSSTSVKYFATLRQRMPAVRIARGDQLARQKRIENAVDLAPEVVPHPLHIELGVVGDLGDRRVGEQLAERCESLVSVAVAEREHVENVGVLAVGDLDQASRPL